MHLVSGRSLGVVLHQAGGGQRQLNFRFDVQMNLGWG
jgi:hypothetical protein